MLVLMTVALAAANLRLPHCIQFCNTILSNQLRQSLQCNCSSITKKNRVTLSEIDTDILKLVDNSRQEAARFKSQKNMPHFHVLFYKLKHKSNVPSQKESKEIVNSASDTNMNTLKPKNNAFSDRFKRSFNKYIDMQIFTYSSKFKWLIILYKFPEMLSSAELNKEHAKHSDSVLRANNRKSYPMLKNSKIPTSKTTSTGVAINYTFFEKEQVHHRIKKRLITKQGKFGKISQELFTNDDLPTNSVKPSKQSTLVFHTNVPTTLMPTPLIENYSGVRNSTKIYSLDHINNNVPLKNGSYFMNIFFTNQSIPVNVLDPVVNNKTVLPFKQEENISKTFSGKGVRKLKRIRQRYPKQILDMDLSNRDPYNEPNYTKQHPKIVNDVPVIRTPANNLIATMQHDMAKSRKTYNENEIPPQKIITKEFKNGTLLSIVNGTEVLPNNDFLIDYEKNTRSRESLEIILWTV